MAPGAVISDKEDLTQGIGQKFLNNTFEPTKLQVKFIKMNYWIKYLFPKLFIIRQMFWQTTTNRINLKNIWTHLKSRMSVFGLFRLH